MLSVQPPNIGSSETPMSGSVSGPVGRRVRPTMRDVAALAGVATKTVSRVINGVPNVDPVLVARVQEAADKLGYRPNLTASYLRRGDGRTQTVGLLLEDVSNPFSSAVLRAVEDVARSRGVLVLIGSLDEDPDRERELARTLIDRRVDGLIIVPAGRDQSYLLAERSAGTGVVFLDREPRLIDADTVVCDNRDGAAAGVQHLVERGHRRIAYLGDVTSIPTAAARLEGYRRALELAGLKYDDSLVVEGLRSAEAAADAASRLLDEDKPPTAIFASQNLVTIGVASALHELGLQHQIALVGFDDFPLADVLSPGVTVIAQDPVGMGRLAADLLFQRLDGDTSEPQTHVVPTRMIVRGSGELAPSKKK